MIRHGIEIEMWLSRFATALCCEQPSVDRSLARDLAVIVQPSLGVLGPEVAAQTFLQVQLQGYNAAGDLASAVLKVLRDRPESA